MDVDTIIARLGGPSLSAKALGQKRTTIAMWRKRGCVPLRHVPNVARVLGVDAGEIWPALRLEKAEAPERQA